MSQEQLQAIIQQLKANPLLEQPEIEAVRAGTPGAADALKWLEGQLPNRRKTLAADPTWGFASVE